MPSKRLSWMVAEMPITMEEAKKVLKEKMPEASVKPFGPDFWLDEDAQALFESHVEAPEIRAPRYRCKILRKAENTKSCVAWGWIEEKNCLVPVFIVRRWYKNIVRKTIDVEQITDADGSTSYRHIPAAG